MMTVTHEETLDELQRRLIAELLSVKPEDVTPEFLDDILEHRVYPKTRLTIGSQFGDHSNSHLRVLTREEFDRIRKEADELFEEAVRSTSRK